MTTAIDRTGVKLYSLTFLRRSSERRGGSILWEAQCECGEIVLVIYAQVAGGKVKTCGGLECRYKDTRKDWSGIKIHQLTYTTPTTERSNGGAVKWNAICDCGNTTTLVPGHAQSCGHLIYDRKYTHPLSPNERSAHMVWSRSYKDGDISFEEFMSLSQLNCDYCNRPPTNTYNFSNKNGKKVFQDGYFTYNGLDRVDNTRGHTLDNVVPYCWLCNAMKRDMTREEFILHIERMYHGTTHRRAAITNSVIGRDSLPNLSFQDYTVQEHLV